MAGFKAKKKKIHNEIPSAAQETLNDLGEIHENLSNLEQPPCSELPVTSPVDMISNISIDFRENDQITQHSIVIF